jgi:hypothetical protein
LEREGGRREAVEPARGTRLPNGESVKNEVAIYNELVEVVACDIVDESLTFSPSQAIMAIIEEAWQAREILAEFGGCKVKNELSVDIVADGFFLAQATVRNDVLLCVLPEFDLDFEGYSPI